MFVDPITHFIITQYGIGAGLKCFQKHVKVVVAREVKQIYDVQTFVPTSST